MTNQKSLTSINAFLFSDEWNDFGNKNSLVFYGTSDLGTVKLIFKNKPVFFIERKNQNIEIPFPHLRKKVNLKSFDFIDVDAIYFNTQNDLPKSKYFDWQKRAGIMNNHNGKIPKHHWHTPEEEKAVVGYVNDHLYSTDRFFRDGYRRLSYRMIDDDVAALSPSSVYRILKKNNLLNPWNTKKPSSKGTGFKQPKKPHQQWHIDIKYIFFGRKFYFLISIIDGYSRFIVNHGLFTDMKTETITTVIQEAKDKFIGVSPKIISDNGHQFISNEFSKFISFIEFKHVKTSVGYPQSNGKTERFHGSFNQEFYKITPLLSFEDAKIKINKYIEEYNFNRLHSSLFYLTPNDFLNNMLDKKLKIREEKLNVAQINRINYWKILNHVFDNFITILN